MHAHLFIKDFNLLQTLRTDLLIRDSSPVRYNLRYYFLLFACSFSQLRTFQRPLEAKTRLVYLKNSPRFLFILMLLKP